MKADKHTLSRRGFVQLACAATCAHYLPSANTTEPIIDIHQHTHYWGRTDADLLQHQRALGVTRTVLLPAGSKYGLEADCYGNDTCLALGKKYPKQFVFFANELPDLPETRQVLEKYLKLGAIGIGEQKFPVECDSKHIELVAAIARAYRVPVLLHFQHNKYNTGFERFYKVLEKFPQVNFIAHAQTWWGNIGQLKDQTDLYPQGPIVPGGLSDKWLGAYPNLYGDLSAGSGMRALLRDEEFTRGFLARHQDKLLYGSDCQDVDIKSDKCCGIRTLDTIRRLAPDETAVRKILFGNAKRVLQLK